MSLAVWLPLNGDLHNLGLSNILLTNNGATVNTNGKIGKCYNVNNSKGIVVNNSITLGTTFSIACWIKINSYNQNWANAFKIYKDGYDYIGLCMNQANATTKLLGFHIYKNNGSNARTGVTDNYYIPLTVGKWYHLCFIVTPTLVITYLDGVKIKTNNITINFPSITNYNLSLGKSSLFSGLDCSINDFRLYDHALTAKEMEEISKGLVLHYKLNNNGMGNLNLVDNSNWAQGTYHWTNWGSPPTREIVKVNGKKWIHLITNTTRFLGYSLNLIKTFGVIDVRVKPKSNTQYTLSFTAYAASAGLKACIGIHWNNETTIVSLSWMEPTLTTIPTRYSAIVTSANSTIDNMNIMVGDSTTTAQELWITDVKIEVGNKLSNWSPYDNNSVIYDSSGYDNNGTIVGSLETITPSPKYSCATFFDNKEYIIHKLPENMYQATYSFWVKASSYTGYGAVYMPYQSPSAGTSPWFAINTESCKVWAYFGNNSPHYTKGSGTMPLNEWHHCVYVWDNGVAQWYVDGEKNGNSVTYTGRTFILNTANATIGNSYTGTSWNGTPFTGEISDFRIYATALTEAQIKELYKTSMIVNGTSVTARDLE